MKPPNDTSQLYKQIKYWTLIFLLTFGTTICIQLLFRYFRIINLADAIHLGIIEFLFTAIILPYYIATICIYISKTFQIAGRNIIYGIIIFACLFISSRLDFINWWDTGGKFVDAESRDVVEIGLTLQFITGLIVSTSALFYFVGRNRIDNTQKS